MSPEEYAHKGPHTNTNTYPSISQPVCWDLQRMKLKSKDNLTLLLVSLYFTLLFFFKVKCLLPPLKTKTKINPMLLASVAALLLFNSK